MKKTEAKALREKIQLLVAEYYRCAFPSDSFVPGKTHIPVSGKIFDEQELQHLVDASLDFWLTTGRFAAKFKKQFSAFFGLKHVLLVNSGSSANLLAVSALTSPLLGDRRLLPGDEVITVAAGFPTTVNPIFQNQLVPVFVDVTIPTYNIDVSQLEAARSYKTKAVMIAHTLGNPFNMEAVTAFTKKYNLWLIENCCDAVGSTYDSKLVGTFGDMATVSFYPAHHITMGEGGCVLTNDDLLERILSSFKNWGRDCWCAPGACNTCGKRFEWKLGDLPHGYDHKYIYSHIGYNLKMTDMQAAVGVAQLAKLPGFIEKRKLNFTKLYQELQPIEDYIILPEATEKSNPSWFGFPVAVRKQAPFTRDDLVAHLEKNNIATRMLFGGNLLRQPAYQNTAYRAVGNMPNSDFVMNNVFWIGIYPGISETTIAYMAETMRRFCAEKHGK